MDQRERAGTNYDTGSLMGSREVALEDVRREEGHGMGKDRGVYVLSNRIYRVLPVHVERMIVGSNG